MKHLNRYHLGILPLLSILTMSPSVMESKFASRAIASVDPEVKTEVKPEVKPEDKAVVETEVKTDVNEEVKNHPKLDAIVSKVDKDSITKDLELTNAQIAEKKTLFIESAKKEKAEFKEASDEVLVKSQREKTESLIKDLVILEALSNKEGLSVEEKEALLLAIAEGKDILEGLLVSLEKNEELVAKSKEVIPEEPKAEEEKPVIADNEEPKKEEPKVEEPKVEEPKKEDVVVVSEEPKKEEPKKEEETKPVVADKEEPKKEEVKKEVCESDEKNKVLTTQVEELMKQNQQILQTMMGMAQMMVSMHQQSQNQNIYQQYQQQMPMPNPYMYQQPMSAGNWVYYPSGFQPNQQNIFAQPQMMQQPMQQQMSIYPDQMHQQQSQWNLRPSQYFGDQRFQTQPIMPGTFGNEAFTFNMGNNVPTITQI